MFDLSNRFPQTFLALYVTALEGPLPSTTGVITASNFEVAMDQAAVFNAEGVKIYNIHISHHPCMPFSPKETKN